MHRKKRQILPVSGPYMAICGFAIRYRLLYEFRLEEKGIPIHVTKTRINWGYFKSCNFSMIITYLQKKMLNILQLHEQFIPKIGAEGYLNLNYYESHRICQMKCWINSENFQRQNPIFFNSFLHWDCLSVNFPFSISLFHIDFPGNGFFEKRPSIGLEALISILDDEEVWTRLFRPRNMSR